jgi:hypothetical protein
LVAAALAKVACFGFGHNSAEFLNIVLKSKESSRIFQPFGQRESAPKNQNSPIN